MSDQIKPSASVDKNTDVSPKTELDAQPIVCTGCGELNPAALIWCEACGHDLKAEPKPPCASCGELAVEDDGYCHSCGHRQPVARDHTTLVEGTAVAVSDRGKRHHHNEDAVAIKQHSSRVAIVVCDGVSSTPASADVSIAAAAAAADYLAESVTGNEAAASDASSGAASDEVMVAAVEAAQAATLIAAEHADSDDNNPPSTTFVAAVAEIDGKTGEAAVSVAWLGDSRAYWVDGDTAHLLTEDHEIAGALTRWLGPDAGVFQPDVAHFRFPPSTTEANGGLLLVCSDGMWRYFSPDMGEPPESLLRRFHNDGQAGLDLAEALVAFANDSGGHDNISVGLWPVPANRRLDDHGEETQQ